MPIALEDFRMGLEVTLKHGTMFEDAKVNNSRLIPAGMIVLAHMKEALDNYERLDVAEIEGALLKSVLSKNLINAQAALNRVISAQLK